MADDSDFEFQEIKAEPVNEEPLEAIQANDDYDSDRQMIITTRPEIRKGCTWDINFKLDPTLLAQESINKIFLSQPKPGKDGAYLALKVRSKLIKPIMELPFSKVAKIVNERDFLVPNDHGNVVLKGVLKHGKENLWTPRELRNFGLVEFTARPRAVFHKHADVMILLAAIKIGERTVCADKLCLVGPSFAAICLTARMLYMSSHGFYLIRSDVILLQSSVHGAEGRIKAEGTGFSNPMMTLQQMQQQMQQMGIPLPQMMPVTVVPMIGSLTPAPSLPPTTPLMQDQSWDGDSSMPITQFDTMNSADLRDDFLQNKGDSLLLNQSHIGLNGLEQPINSFSNSDDSNGDWPMGDADQLDGGYASNIMATSKPDYSSVSQSSNQAENATSEPNQNYTIVFNKRRGCCTDCVGDCSYYKGIGGPCNECGCYPARHVDLDAPKAQNLKRSASQAGLLLNDSRESKRPRFLLEAKFFQKLFFSCMQFMTLPEIARVANAAPIPIFVKDEKSMYIYINPTFCHFITDLSRTERVLNHTPQQIFEPRDASEVVGHDQFLLQQGEGTLKTFDVSIKKQEFRVMKEFCALRDGKRVILGAVISSL